MPLQISTSSTYGQPPHPWATLTPNESKPRVVLTGTRYAYCFAQAAGHGYAATRACGTWSLHQYLNGAQLPDGSPSNSTLEFARR